MDQGPEDISDAAINAQIRRQARSVQIKSVATGLIATAILLVI